jgi:hypothetical protein
LGRHRGAQCGGFLLSVKACRFSSIGQTVIDDNVDAEIHGIEFGACAPTPAFRPIFLQCHAPEVTSDSNAEPVIPRQDAPMWSYLRHPARLQLRGGAQLAGRNCGSGTRSAIQW